MGKKAVRRAQAIVPFGVGAIVDFENEALMAAGLDAWEGHENPIWLAEDRLAKRLHVRRFRLPPPAPDRRSPDPTAEPLPFVRFPYWHFCPVCRALTYIKRQDRYPARCWRTGPSPTKSKLKPCGERPKKKRPKLIPVRFIVACREGHIQDFPWHEWAHSKGTALAKPDGCYGEELYFYATQRGGLAGLVVECRKCDKRRSLLGATRKGLPGLQCHGLMPWLGSDARDTCTATDEKGVRAPPVVLQRGASNLYFPEVVSAVLIPPFSKKIRAIVDDEPTWEHLTSVRENGEIPKNHVRGVAKMRRVDPDELIQAVKSKESGEGEGKEGEGETEFRFAEYNALSRDNNRLDDQLVTRVQSGDFFEKAIQPFVDNVVLVESLAETRALVGFSRIEPSSRSGRKAKMSLSRRNWLPAYRVQGEGLFITFKRDALSAWRTKLGNGLDTLIRRAAVVPRFNDFHITPDFIALHTLAHSMILRLSFEAGYGASSIRERIYSAPESSGTAMAGILLYTAAGDSEGTLGGLVRLGVPGAFERVLIGAIHDMDWCGADPVCRESPGQGVGSLNLAACHACGLLPETSCEFGNRLLDRMSVVGPGVDGERFGLLRDLLP